MLWTCSTAKIRASGVTFLLSALPVPSEEDGLKPAPQGRMLVSAVQRALLLADPENLWQILPDIQILILFLFLIIQIHQENRS